MSEFTGLDGLAWLGLTEETYDESWKILDGRHGNPLMAALLDVRTTAQRDATTPADVLAKHGIDPTDPLAAVRAYDRSRARYDD